LEQSSFDLCQGVEPAFAPERKTPYNQSNDRSCGKERKRGNVRHVNIHINGQGSDDCSTGNSECAGNQAARATRVERAKGWNGGRASATERDGVVREFEAKSRALQRSRGGTDGDDEGGWKGRCERGCELMAIERQFVDTNVLVRFFSGDPPEMAERARKLIERADSGEVVLVVGPVIVAEVFFRLVSDYDADRREVAQKLAKFLGCRGIEATESAAMTAALKRCENDGAHFADAFLAAVALAAGEAVASFDRDFDKFKGVRRIEP
jgi:predicted nucleic acid-binding protein